MKEKTLKEAEKDFEKSLEEFNKETQDYFEYQKRRIAIRGIMIWGTAIIWIPWCIYHKYYIMALLFGIITVGQEVICQLISKSSSKEK